MQSLESRNARGNRNRPIRPPNLFRLGLISATCVVSILLAFIGALQWISEAQELTVIQPTKVSDRSVPAESRSIETRQQKIERLRAEAIELDTQFMSARRARQQRERDKPSTGRREARRHWQEAKNSLQRDFEEARQETLAIQASLIERSRRNGDERFEPADFAIDPLAGLREQAEQQLAEDAPSPF